MNSIEYIISETAREEILELFASKGYQTKIRSFNDFSIPKILYKYSGVNKYLINNLKNNSLTATTPTEFNDLYDSTMHFDNSSQYRMRFKELNEGSRRFGMKDVISPELEADLLKQAIELDKFGLTYLSKDFSIVCLSSDFNDIKMWSHYANNNKGICLGYDFRKGKYDLEKFIYPVFYIDSPIDVTELCKNDDKIMLSALTSVISKFRDWEHENEWRIILHFLNNKKVRMEIVNIPNPEFIILGNKFIENIEKSRMKDKNEFLVLKEFVEYVKDQNIELRVVKPQIRSFKLVFEKIDVNEILREFS